MGGKPKKKLKTQMKGRLMENGSNIIMANGIGLDLLTNERLRKALYKCLTQKPCDA